MTKEELDRILAAHKAWLNNEPGGNRADLSWADLKGGDSFEMARDRGSSLDCGGPAAGRRSVPVDSGNTAGNGRGSVIAAIYRACAILMALLVVMLTGAWAEGLQSWGEAWTIAGICSVVAYLMLRGAGDV